MSLNASVIARDIREVVHFTTNRGLAGALATGNLKSRPLLKESEHLKHVLQLNSSERPEESEYFDKSEEWIRFVNLSISEINRRFFEISKGWHTDKDVWWCILSFEPSIIKHDGVHFATTNNSYDQCIRGRGVEGFEALFAPRVSRKSAGVYGPWSVPRRNRENHLPTCEQAEILYPEEVSLRHLAKVYVEDESHQDIVEGWLNDDSSGWLSEEFDPKSVSVETDPAKFIGKKN